MAGTASRFLQKNILAAGSASKPCRSPLGESMLDGVLITDTFVLDWYFEPRRLVFVVDASLQPDHPANERSKPNEWACYKPARLVLDDVECVEGLLEPASAPGHTDPDGSHDFGSIDELVSIVNGFRICGEFGDVQITANSVRLEVAGG
jgi:hypothetical protein